MSIAMSSPLIADPYLDIDDYDSDADLMVLNLGPQHPSTHGVFRIKLILDGEIIIKAIAYPGYLHRGVEKLCEKLTYAMITPIVDKNDYISPMINEQAINMAFESLMGVEVPRRGRWIRTILAEMQRVASHLIALGTFAMDLGGAIGGGASLFMYMFRDRELILDCFEELTGCRFHYNTHIAGGQRHDLPEGWSKKVKTSLAQITQHLKECEQLVVENPIFADRTKGVGIIPQQLALELGLQGPIARASGVDMDLRRDAPYHCYDEIKMNVITESSGDTWARFMVRLKEAQESIRVATEMVDGVPVGPIFAGKVVKTAIAIKIKEGQSYVALESPRGELGTYLIAGGSKGTSPYRLKIRPPSLHAISAIPYLLPGNNVSDAIAILGSLDPVMGEVDR